MEQQRRNKRWPVRARCGPRWETCGDVQTLQTEMGRIDAIGLTEDVVQLERTLVQFLARSSVENLSNYTYLVANTVLSL